MDRGRDNLGRRQMSVQLAGEISGVENSDSCDFDHVHGCAKYVSGPVGCEGNSAGQSDRLVKRRSLNHRHGLVNVRARIYVIFSRDSTNSGEVLPEQFANWFGRMRHENPSLEISAAYQVRDRPGMVQVEVGYQAQVDLGHVRDLIKEG
jgi:hypothetical protein